MRHFLKIVVLLVSFSSFAFLVGCQSQEEKEEEVKKISEDGQHLKFLASLPAGTLLLCEERCSSMQPVYFIKGQTNHGSFVIAGVNMRVVWDIDTVIKYSDHLRFVPVDQSLWKKIVAREGFGIDIPEK